MFKFFVLAAFVATVTISVNAQTTGSSSSGGAVDLGGMVAETMSQIAEKVVSILELLGGLLSGKNGNLNYVLNNLVQNLASTVCLVLQLVNQILSELGGKTQGLHMCPISGGISLPPMGSTVSGSVGL